MRQSRNQKKEDNLYHEGHEDHEVLRKFYKKRIRTLHILRTFVVRNGLSIKYLERTAPRKFAQPTKTFNCSNTKNTKFLIKNIRILRGLRELRGENLFRQVLLRCCTVVKKFAQAAQTLSYSTTEFAEGLFTMKSSFELLRMFRISAVGYTEA